MKLTCPLKPAMFQNEVIFSLWSQVSYVVKMIEINEHIVLLKSKLICKKHV
jgi:hypothetical protein